MKSSTVFSRLKMTFPVRISTVAAIDIRNSTLPCMEVIVELMERIRVVLYSRSHTMMMKKRTMVWKMKMVFSVTQPTSLKCYTAISQIIKTI